MYNYNHTKGNYEAYECYQSLPMLNAHAGILYMYVETYFLQQMFKRMITRLLYRLTHEPAQTQASLTICLNTRT